MVDSPNPTEQKIMRNISQDTGDETLNTPEDPNFRVPVYKMYQDSIRPTSKHHGPLWKSRKDAAYNKLSRTGKIDNWDEAVRYYKNDQRKDRQGQAGTTRSQKNVGRDSENLVFANTSALVPAIYAKNPVCEITSNLHDDHQEGGPDDMLMQLIKVVERLVNALASKKSTPGINLKPKARKGVVMTTLTNVCYFEVGYTRRQESSEEALIDLDNATKKLAEAKDQKTIEEAEGELMALEQKIDFLRPSGPWVKFRHPKDVLRDPDSMGADLEDDKWIMISDYISTQYINAVYRDKTSDTEYKSIYKATHVIGTTSPGGVEEEINNFSILKDELDYRSFGYNDQETYNKALRTKVWYVWDKITRRVYMYNDGDWSWPIWVWDDPYRLEGFFPVYPLMFYTDPEDDIGNSEVSYYLDQQDAVNEINDELRKIRMRIMGTLFYNKNVIKDPSTIEAYIRGEASKTAVGIDADREVDLSKAFFALLPPSAQYIQLLDKNSYIAAASRVSSVQPIMQGQEFKTNTTNEAIETYNSTQQTRLDEKIDAVEDCIGEILWAVVQMCLQFMTKEEVATILGPADASIWQNMNPEQIQQNFSVRIVGGSTQKPTARVKKEEALKMGQILGQYANAGGGAVILIMLKVMERAFDELTIGTEDWQLLREGIMQQLQAQQAPPPEAAAQEQAPQGSDTDRLLAEISGQINQLPPEAKRAVGKALGDAMAQGVPIEEAIPLMIEQLNKPPEGAVQ